MNPTSSRSSRWRRRFIWCGVLVALLVGLYFLATSPLVVKAVVVSRLGAALGGTVEADSVSLKSGVLTMQEPRLLANGVSGPAAQIFRAQRIETKIDLPTLWRGGQPVREVTLDQPVFRISQSVDDGSLNVLALHPAPGAGGGSGVSREMPRLTVRGGVIELGEHISDPAKHPSGPQFTSLKRFQVEGDVVRSDTEDGVSVVTFRQVEAPGVPAAPGSLAVEGRVSKDSITLNLSNLKLEECPPDAIPSPLRENFRALNLSGEIGGATLVYKFDGGAEARVGLTDVALTLPITPEPHYDDHGVLIPAPKGQEDRRPRMQNVKGQLVLTDKGASGEVRGKIEDLPYDVKFDVRGTDASAPFTCRLVCREFELKEHPDIVVFAPAIVRNRLAQFSNPTGTVNADVTISRESAAGDVIVRGLLTLTGGTAAFERFPYRFSNVSARAEFDETSVRLTSVTGEAAGGVKLAATADISPLTEDAGVDVKVNVTGLPVDEVLHEAMKKRGKLIDELFNAAAYKRMTDQELVISPARAKELNAKVAELRAAGALSPAQQAELSRAALLLTRPVFEPGGIATVQVGVQRKIGPESIWNDQVKVHFDQVNLVPQAFSYPLRATDVTLVKTDFDAIISGGSYHGLRGGDARIAAKVNLEKFDAPGVPFVPDVEIEATGIPMDDLLLFAIPDAQGLSPDGKPLRELVRRLHVEGKGNAQARVFQLPDGEPGYKIQIDLSDVTAHPHADGAPARLALTGVSGGIDVGHDGLEIDLSTVLGRTEPSGESVAGTPASVKASVTWPASADPAQRRTQVSLTGRAASANIATPIEDVVAVFSPEAAEAIAATRAERKPEGAADVRCELSKAGPGPMRITTAVTNLRGAAIDAAGSRVVVDSSAGELLYERSGIDGGGDVARFRDFAASITASGIPSGNVTLRGGLLTSGKPAPDEKGLSVELRSGRWESPLVREAVKAFGPKAAAEFLTASNGAGEFDLRLEMTPARAGDAWASSGSLNPRSWSGSIDGTPVSLGFAGDGAIDFNPAGGGIHGLNAVAPAWKATIDGGWLRSADGGVAAQTTLSVDAASLSPDLAAMLPSAVRGLLTDLSVKGAGPVKSAASSVSLTFGAGGELAAFKTAGRIEAEGVSFDPGVSVDRCRAVVDFSAQRTGPGNVTEFEVYAHAPTLAASGIAMTNARVRVNSGPSGEILLPYFSADAHGGRITGTASVAAPAAGRREFTAQVQGASIRFAPVLADWQAATRAAPILSRDAEPPDASRGVMDFGVSVTGFLGEPASRRGRGSVLIGDGRVMNMPLVVALVRFSNLQLPVDEKLDYAQADFFFAGSKIELERAWISSPTVEIYGFGAASWPDLTLDTRFRTRARSRIPLVSGVMEKIRNELVTATVTGTVGAPVVSVQSFGGAARLVKGVFGQEATMEERRLDQIMAMSQRDPRRTRESAPGEVAAQPK